MHPEEKARLVIDAKLKAAGYAVQDMSELNPYAKLGVVVREFQTSSGPADYLIFIAGKPVGFIEAKAHDKAESLATVAEQTKRYAESTLKYVKGEVDIRFGYEATDVITQFCDYHDKNYRSREVFWFHQPEQLKAWIDDDSTLRNRLKEFPRLDPTGFRDCQVSAIRGLEKSFSEDRPRALMQMATGAGKTYTAVTNAYRLLKFAKAKRILFLVDTKNLGKQAEEEFKKYMPSDDTRLFPELYNVRRLTSSVIPTDSDVCISTIQRMYSILKGQDLDESDEEEPFEEMGTEGDVREVVYNVQYPPEFFDFIIVDECHRSIYNVWQQVLDYFDAFIVGLTATPDKRTYAFFNQNVVSEYTHEDAIIDGVNVGGDVYLIETAISKNGATIVKQVIEKRDRLSRQKRWEQMDEDVTYAAVKLDKDVVNPSQIRTIIRAFRDKITTEIFPGREEVPKTLIFAKSDSHADDIIRIVREEFGQGNEFCKKITYRADDADVALTAFRNEYNPRIAVTVDMIATGTDVKPIECLLFMRDVKSKNYYEQMLGRARRVLTYEELAHVTPSARSAKTRYAVIDAIGITKTKKTDSRPLERKPTVSLHDLMLSVATGARDDDTLTTLASRFLRLNREIDVKEGQKIKQLSGGTELNLLARNMLDAFDEDKITAAADKQPDGSVTEEDYEKAQSDLIDAAVEPIFNPDLRKYIEDVRKSHDQIIDNVNIDEPVFVGWDAHHEEKAEQAIETFRAFLEDNKDELEALQIIYSRSYRERPLTLRMIKEVYDKMKSAPYRLSHQALWSAYEIKHPDKVEKKGVVAKLMDIISLVRFEIGQEGTLVSFADHVRAKFKEWVFAKNAGNVHFTPEQMEWLYMLRDYIAMNANVTLDDMELTPFADEGGLGRYYQLFGDQYEAILDDLSAALAA